MTIPHITWTTFLISLSLLLLFYYLIIGGYFYRFELRQFFKSTRPLPSHHPLFLHDDELKIQEQEFQPEELELINSEDPYESASFPNADTQRVELLIEKLKDGVVEASEQELQPLAYHAHLRKIISSFPDLKDSPFQPAINEFLFKECQTYGAIALSNEEVQQLWLSGAADYT